MLASLNAVPSSQFTPGWNYLVEENPFGLAGPPQWFLEDLWAFDPCLVIFPSKEEPVYRLARRTEHGMPLLTFLRHRPDTQMFVRHRLQPVTSILPPPFVQWSPVLLRDLAERDTRRIGGARRAADALDRFDDDADSRWRQDVADGAEIRARASWRGQKWTRGETVDLGGRRLHHGRTGLAPRRHSMPGLRPTGSSGGALFLGRDILPEKAAPYRDDDAGSARRLIVAA